MSGRRALAGLIVLWAAGTAVYVLANLGYAVRIGDGLSRDRNLDAGDRFSINVTWLLLYGAVLGPAIMLTVTTVRTLRAQTHRRTCVALLVAVPVLSIGAIVGTAYYWVEALRPLT